MKIFLNAKTALLISFAFLFCSDAFAKMEIIPQMDCGDYLIRGHFILNNKGSFLLRIRENSTSPFEFIVLGGKSTEKLEYRDANVVLKVSVEKKITSNNQPFVKLIAFENNRQSIPADEDYKLLTGRKCK